MNKLLMDDSARYRRTVSIFRGALALTMIVHGAARVIADGVAPFGDFLTAQGLPAGAWAAWAVTVFELAGGILFLLGRFVRPVGLLFAAELAAGIVLVHAAHGWFVVGLGRNGMEYSVLLIVGFLGVALAGGARREKPPELSTPAGRSSSML